MNNRNKHGLTRYISEQTKRKVRQQSYFGCVLCGCGLYQYEHFDPPFENCKEHNPEGITLLCGTHQDKKTRGFLPTEVIEKALQNPYAKKNGFWDELYLQKPVVVMGNNEFVNIQALIEVNGRPLLKIDPPEEVNSPFLLSGVFFDTQGNQVLEIIKNEWHGNPSCWDVITRGGQIIIKSKDLILLHVKVRAPEKLIIAELNMTYDGHKFHVKEGEFSHIKPNGGRVTQIGCHWKSDVLMNSFLIKSNLNQTKFFGTDNFNSEVKK